MKKLIVSKFVIVLVLCFMANVMLSLTAQTFTEGLNTENLIEMFCVSVDTYVNVREKPSTKAHSGGRLDFGDKVMVSDQVTDSSGTSWYRVNGITEQGYGYVCANYLVPTKPEKCNTPATVTATGRVAVYKRVDGPRKKWVKNGASVTVTIYSDGWCLTNLGWIRTKYLQLDQQ